VVKASVQRLSGQQSCDNLPQLAVAVWQPLLLQVPAAPHERPLAMHSPVAVLQQPPSAQKLSAQQGWSLLPSPQGRQTLLKQASPEATQKSGALPVVPAQHGSSRPPQPPKPSAPHRTLAGLGVGCSWQCPPPTPQSVAGLADTHTVPLQQPGVLPSLAVGQLLF
jgi:hypothetical protein